ncbi:MAG: hypothetical protein QXV17_10430, partial [Candidatus Micrarchaeaceae archaeon]
PPHTLTHKTPTQQHYPLTPTTTIFLIFTKRIESNTPTLVKTNNSLTSSLITTFINKQLER